MKKTDKIWVSVAILVILAALITVAISYFFGVKVVSSGEAYGFQIGDDRKQSFEKAQTLLNQQKISAIHTWPSGEVHRPFRQEEYPNQSKDKSWVMVVNSEWWNNTITVTFNNNKVVEIRRDRICCEMP